MLFFSVLNKWIGESNKCTHYFVILMHVLDNIKGTGGLIALICESEDRYLTTCK
jgi:hypothetical protein